MSWMVESIVDPDPCACPRCGGMGNVPDHTCLDGCEADAEYVNGKIVWTFTTKSGRVLSPAVVERQRLERQLRRTNEAIREALPLFTLKRELIKKLKKLAGKL